MGAAANPAAGSFQKIKTRFERPAGDRVCLKVPSVYDCSNDLLTE
jgi:hypothetical protein